MLPTDLLTWHSVTIFVLGIDRISSNGSICNHLKSDSHVENFFCQIKIFPSLIQKNTIICLHGV